jgi:hypothetical protein
VKRYAASSIGMMNIAENATTDFRAIVPPWAPFAGIPAARLFLSDRLIRPFPPHAAYPGARTRFAANG